MCVCTSPALTVDLVRSCEDAKARRYAHCLAASGPGPAAMCPCVQRLTSHATRLAQTSTPS